MGTPVAVMCELRESLDTLAVEKEEVRALLKDPESLKHLTWQSYLKEGGDSKGCS